MSASATCRIKVLASGSAGNCTVVQTTARGRRTTLLIDLGLSPRRTVRELDTIGLGLADIDAVLMTHLDIDHCHGGWSPAAGKVSRLPITTRVYLPRSHVGRATRAMFNGGRVEGFKGDFETAQGLCISPTMLRHDALGTAAFRIALAGGTLGFATDVGRASETLIEHLRFVDVLAIESNYCPEMQAASNRPAQLKARIMGGSGHLS
ncbi:MAG: MBL fold metallo-hydrolase, partial [Phycisphaerales bacterium]